MRTDAVECGTEKLRRNDRDNDVGIANGGVVTGTGDRCWDRETGKKERVLTSGDDLLCEFRTVSPERELMAAATMQ
jgi:hypothetical protein